MLKWFKTLSGFNSKESKEDSFLATSFVSHEDTHVPVYLTISNTEYGASTNKVIIQVKENKHYYTWVYLFRYGYRDGEYGSDIWELLVGYPIDVVQYFLHNNDLDNDHRKLSSIQFENGILRIQAFDDSILSFRLNEQEQQQFRREIILKFERELISVYNTLTQDEMKKFRKDIPELF